MRASGRVDLVLMDWRMPGIDGLELTRWIRAQATLRQPRIVMLTASAFEEEKQPALAAGADDFLRKPLEADKLFAPLEQQLALNFVRREVLLAGSAPRCCWRRASSIPLRPAPSCSSLGRMARAWCRAC